MSSFIVTSTLGEGFAGGLMIGLAAAILLLFSGDILGASGIVSTTALSPIKALKDPSQYWKIVFIASFLLCSLAFARSYASKTDELRENARSLSIWAYLLAGFFVGFGTKMGNGCTSGHGICGLPRFSIRSFVAVSTFMFTGVLTSVVTSPDIDSLNNITEFLRDSDSDFANTTGWSEALGIALAVLFSVAAVAAPVMHRLTLETREDPPEEEARRPGKSSIRSFLSNNAYAKFFPAVVAGVLFSSGLYVSTMVFQAKVFGFLDVSAIPDGDWDPTLAFVMMGGLLISFASYQWITEFRVIKITKALEHPVALQCDANFGVPTNKAIDAQLLSGAAMFGVGWGIAGICPGPGLFLAAVGIPSVLKMWWPAFFAGSFLAKVMKEHSQKSSLQEDPKADPGSSETQLETGEPDESERV